MRLLIDENIGQAVVDVLRQLGHDVRSIIEDHPGASDTEVLELARDDNRILVTSDTDFGELIYLRKQTHKGVILLRLVDEANENKIRVLRALFSSYAKRLKEHFVVVTESRVRIRSTQGKNES